MTMENKSPIAYGPLKLLGAYPQRQEGQYMQRIPVMGGCIEAVQLRQIAGLSQRFANGTPLHITTRQDIELHHVPESQVAAVQAELGKIGISTYGAGGDSIRNITVCPCCAFDPQAVDVLPLAEQVREAILAEAPTLNLPRKFKLSFTGCRNEGARPYVQDLGFVAASPDSVRVIGAGSLGPRPQPGIVLYDSIMPEDVLPLIGAALEIFAEHGDRENRRTARLRHIRQRTGDDAFKKMLDEAFQWHRSSAHCSGIRLSNGQAGFEKRFTLQTLGGKLTCEQALALTESAITNAVQLRINLWHGIDLYSRTPFELPSLLQPLTHRPRIIACPGSSTCKNGLTDCRAAAETMADVLSRAGRNHLTVGISGCPNNCAHSAICDIGLIGRQKTIEGTRQDAYDIYVDGGNGVDARLAVRKDTIPASGLSPYFSR